MCSSIGVNEEFILYFYNEIETVFSPLGGCGIKSLQWGFRRERDQVRDRPADELAGKSSPGPELFAGRGLSSLDMERFFRFFFYTL